MPPDPLEVPLPRPEAPGRVYWMPRQVTMIGGPDMQLVPHYQKIMDITAVKCIGYEVTIRGYQEGWIGAEAILSGLSLEEIPSFDNEVHVSALSQKPHDGLLFLNCEMGTLEQQRLILPSSELGRIVLELTERSPSGVDICIIREYLEPFRNAGMKIAIDDFGTGYANFEWVAALTPDYLKIDHSILRNIQDVRKQRFLEGLTSFGQAIRTNIIAEGVETDYQHDFLTATGIRYAQGYYYDRPAPIKPVYSVVTKG